MAICNGSYDKGLRKKVRETYSNDSNVGTHASFVPSSQTRSSPHTRHERELNLVRRISHASLARTLARRTLSGAALPFPDLDLAGFLPIAADLARPPRRSPVIAVPDGALKIPVRRRRICRRIRHLQRHFDLDACGVPEDMVFLVRDGGCL
ncbi:hypothetical protein GmHk_18G053025 [Glycine max]|nr:hypothetical protein GmHk_18G053025 [Glycine max]KAH1199745.1 hypothetical protein GmHk_18G053025 [Glycine max]